MARRADPERLAAAHRAGVRTRLVGQSMSPERAEEWLARWEAHEVPGSFASAGRYWNAAFEWIVAQRR
jgi:hypothetical protein